MTTLIVSICPLLQRSKSAYSAVPIRNAPLSMKVLFEVKYFSTYFKIIRRSLTVEVCSIFFTETINRLPGACQANGRLENRKEIAQM